MYERCPASLKMTRLILQDGYYDENTYDCQVITYNSEKESIYLLAGENELPVFSLDGLYECVMVTEQEEVKCIGVIKERYKNKMGGVIEFYIQNGFYKNLVN